MKKPSFKLPKIRKPKLVKKETINRALKRVTSLKEPSYDTEPRYYTISLAISVFIVGTLSIVLLALLTSAFFSNGEPIFNLLIAILFGINAGILAPRLANKLELRLYWRYLDKAHLRGFKPNPITFSQPFKTQEDYENWILEQSLLDQEDMRQDSKNEEAQEEEQTE